MEATAALDLDDIIRRLLAAKDPPSSPRAPAPLTPEEIRRLCSAAKELLLTQPTLLTVPAPVNVCGDIHGQYLDLLRLFGATGDPSADNRYLFLGDYVDRGKQSVETICLLLAYKLKFPDGFFLLRGNHECEAVNKILGFFDECRSRRLVRSIWKAFNDVFACLPLAALIVSGRDGCTRRIMCVHGGLSPELQSLDQIRNIERPLAEVPEPGLACDLLWSDPADEEGHKGWRKPRRSKSFTFGADVVASFCEQHGLDKVCRAHEMKMGGYDDQFAGGKLVTVFSAPNYLGRCGNDGAVMVVGEDLACYFHILKPTQTATPSVMY
jgi:serine/threonine-protein phosphatase PP1 catalytic subunit